jgi:hypothetical protein
MDLLDKILPASGDLLDRVDRALLTLGAPADHPIWTLTRRLGATPASAVGAVAALSPAAVREPVAPLHRAAEECRSDVASLPSSLDSQGMPAQAYRQRRRELAARLSDGDESLAERLAATAAYLDDVATWIESSRRRVAGALATSLGSREAVTLRAAGGGDSAMIHGAMIHGPIIDGPAIGAAADIGAHLLAVVAECVEGGWEVHARWSGPVGEVIERSPLAMDLPESDRIELR